MRYGPDQYLELPMISSEILSFCNQWFPCRPCPSARVSGNAAPRGSGAGSRMGARVSGGLDFWRRWQFTIIISR